MLFGVENPVETAPEESGAAPLKMARWPDVVQLNSCVMNRDAPSVSPAPRASGLRSLSSVAKRTVLLFMAVLRDGVETQPLPNVAILTIAMVRAVRLRVMAEGPWD